MMLHKKAHVLRASGLLIFTRFVLFVCAHVPVYVCYGDLWRVEGDITSLGAGATGVREPPDTGSGI